MLYRHHDVERGRRNVTERVRVAYEDLWPHDTRYAREIGSAAIDALAKQIEPQFRDLGLLHPDIDLFFTVTHGGSDRDGKEATILDLLVKYGVIQNDNISSCNGMVVTHPARRADVDGVLIILKDTGINRWPDKPKEKRKNKS